jgi:hypothetical protein
MRGAGEPMFEGRRCDPQLTLNNSRVHSVLLVSTLHGQIHLVKFSHQLAIAPSNVNGTVEYLSNYRPLTICFVTYIYLPISVHNI